MNESRLSDKKWTDDDTEALFAAIGRYLVTFQWIEGKLDQILLLGWGHDHWAASQAKLATMKNDEKIGAVRKLVFESPAFARSQEDRDWCDKFERLLGRLHEERVRRNSLAHSQFLFEFVEVGLPPMRSNRKKSSGEPIFDREDLTKEAQSTLLAGVGQLALDVGWAHVQLIADYRSQATLRPSTKPRSRQDLEN